VNAPAARVAMGVLGAGLLFVPALASEAGAGHSLGGWLVQVAMGAVMVASLVPAGRASGARGAAGLLTAAAGVPGGAAIRAFYLVGTTAGQAVVALAGGAYAAVLVGVPAPLLAAGIALAATALAVAGWTAGTRARYLLFGSVLVLVAAAAAATLGRPAALRPALTLAPVSPQLLGVTAFVAFFASVGYDDAAGLGGRVAGGLAGVAIAAVVFLAAAAAADAATLAGHGGPAALVASLPAPVRAAAAAAAAALCALACSRNLRGLARLSGQLAEASVLPAALAGGRRMEAAFGALVLAEVGVSAWAGWGAGRFILVPDAMALTIFLGCLGTAAWLARGPARALPAAGLALCLGLAPFAGLALLWPAAVLGAVLGARAWRARSVAGGPVSSSAGR